MGRSRSESETRSRTGSNGAVSRAANHDPVRAINAVTCAGLGVSSPNFGVFPFTRKSIYDVITRSRDSLFAELRCKARNRGSARHQWEEDDRAKDTSVRSGRIINAKGG